MPGSNRINLLSLFCSCVGNAVILGGIMYGLSQSSQEKLGLKQASRPLVIELVPLDRADTARGDFAGQKREDVRVALSRRDGGHVPKRIEPPVVAAASVEVDRRGEPKPNASGESGGDSAVPSAFELSAYQRRLYEALARNSRYPAEARRMRLSGVTRLAFRIDRVGHVVESWIQESSGSELLDDAALEALGRAQPLPPIPVSLPSRLDFVIEIDLSTMQQFASRAAG